MSDIRKVTICRKPSAGSENTAASYELTVNDTGAKLMYSFAGSRKHHAVDDTVLLESALDRIEELVSECGNGCDTEATGEVLYADGTIKHADAIDLECTLISLLPSLPDDLLRPQGLVQAQPLPVTAADTLCMPTGFAGIQEMPMLQGIVPAYTPDRTPPETGSWRCAECGGLNTGGKFCSQCGSPKEDNT